MCSNVAVLSEFSKKIVPESSIQNHAESAENFHAKHCSNNFFGYVIKFLDKKFLLDV
jgi:hypothetical protein